MATTRARVAADALPEGRVTRSQAAQLPSGKRGGAEEDAAKARTRPKLGVLGRRQAAPRG